MTNFDTRMFRLIDASLFAAAICVAVVLSGCGAMPLAEEPPYSDMIGGCQVLQQSMSVRRNVCWDIGDAILSPDESRSCFKETLISVPSGTRIQVVDVRQKRFGEWGACPQMSVQVEGANFSEPVFLPLCASRKHLSWLIDPMWYRGQPIKLKPEYVQPCPSRP
jgi:hypothetical protein